MEHHLRENIRRCRREMELTQAQLAEAMGVTIGAVSKWESGASIPDIGTLIGLANFFQRSVDALLGYRKLNTGWSELVEQIRACSRQSDMEKGIPLAQQALLRYPNRFDVVFHSAYLFLVGATVQNQETMLERALELFRRAEGLLDQNTDPSLGRRTLMLAISSCLSGLGRKEEALKALADSNDGGVNNYQIGYMLAEEGRFEEARKPLAESMMDCVWRMMQTCMGMANCLVGEKRYAAALEQLHWLIALLDSLNPGEPCYLDRYTAMLFACSAGGRLELGDRQGAEAMLQEAKVRALRYDSQPDPRINLRFYQGRPSFAHDDLGSTALGAIPRVLEQQGESAGTLLTLWKRMEQEESEKE